MKKKTAAIGSAAAAGVLLLGGATAVYATGQGDSSDGENEHPLTGSTLEKASQAALDAVGSGKVTETENGDEKGVAYEVEVTLPNGDQVDVELDSKYQVVAKEHDHADGQGDDESSDAGGDD